jgi:hypothetical protein
VVDKQGRENGGRLYCGIEPKEDKEIHTKSFEYMNSGYQLYSRKRTRGGMWVHPREYCLVALLEEDINKNFI